MHRILFAEDDPTTRMVVSEFLRSEGYDVVAVEDGQYAVEALAMDSQFDLLLSDIDMPRLQGHMLLSRVEKTYPDIRRVLLTGYDADKYMSIATQFGISNIITKTNPFNLKDLGAYLDGLLRGDVFGIERYLEDDTQTKKLEVLNSGDIAGFIKTILTELPFEDSSMLEQAFVEVLTNAVYYGVFDSDGANKHEWEVDIDVPPGQVEVNYGCDDEKLVVGIKDTGGKLDKKKIMFWLSRQIRKNAMGLPLGITDSHGRGLFLSREYMDRLVVNIERGKRTEIICVKYLKAGYEGPKPLLINEI